MITTIFKPRGGMSQTAVLMLLGIHSANEEQFLFCTWVMMMVMVMVLVMVILVKNLKHPLVHLLDRHPAAKDQSHCKIPGRYMSVHNEKYLLVDFNLNL